MPERYHLEYQDTVSHEQEALLFEGLNDDAFHAKGMNPIQTFGIFIKDSDQNLLGGAKGVTYYGCLYVDMLWVDKRVRRQGWGAKLMQEAEKIGKKRGCTFATVGTMDWEALPFYQKLGYAIEFVREGYENDSKMFLLRKKL